MNKRLRLGVHETNDAILKDASSHEDVAAENHLAFAEVLERTESDCEPVVVSSRESSHIAIDSRLVDAGSDAERAIRNYSTDRPLWEVGRADDCAESKEARDDTILDSLGTTIDICIHRAEQSREVRRVKDEDGLVRIDALRVSDGEEVSKRLLGGQVNSSSLGDILEKSEDILVGSVSEHAGDCDCAIAEEVHIRLASGHIVERDALDEMLVECDSDTIDVLGGAPVVRGAVEVSSILEVEYGNRDSRTWAVFEFLEVVGEEAERSHVLLDSLHSVLTRHFEL